MKMWGYLFACLVSGALSWLAWKVSPELDQSNIQPIASTIASISGMLFGFVLASLSILVSASDNKLIRNTKKTGYFDTLLHRLQLSMASLILVCMVFLTVMFVPDDLGSGFFATNFQSILLASGVFLFSLSLCVFISVWYEFSTFAKNL